MWDYHQIERAGKKDIASKDDAQLRQQLEGGDHGEMIKFKAVWGAKAALTPEEIEADTLAKLSPKERVRYQKAKRLGEKHSMDVERKLLPVYNYRQELLDAIKEYPVLVIVG